MTFRDTYFSRVPPSAAAGARARASIMLLRASRALAASNGRDYVIPDDVKKLVVPVMSHRIILSADAAMGGRSTKSVLTDLLAEVSVPVRGKA